MPPEAGRFMFDPFEFEPGRGRLTRAGEEIHLRPKTLAVLQYLLERAGQLVSRNELLAAIWPEVVVTEDSLAQCVIELRRALDDDQRSMVRTVRGRGLILEVPVHREGEDDGAPPRQSFLWHKRHGGKLIAALTVVGALMLWWAATRGPAVVPADATVRAPAAHSIAVLPFEDLSPADDQSYLADGISEEILHSLAQVPGLAVTARTSSAASKGSTDDIRAAGRRLQVAYLVEGSVRVEDDAVRISARLVSAEDGRNLWSETFERAPDDVFDVHTTIAELVAEALQVERPVVDGPFAGHEPDPEAYRLVLRGQVLYWRRGGDDVRSARDLFRRATEIDPDYAIAWARLAATTRILYFDGLIEYGELVRVGVPAANRALELRPDLAEVQFRFGNYADMVGDHRAAWVAYENVYRIEPDNPLLLGILAGRAIFSGDARRAVEFQRRLVQLDPLSYTPRHNLAVFLYAAGQFDAMREVAEIALALNPKNRTSLSEYLARAAIVGGRYDEALSLLESLPAGPTRDALLVLVADQPGQSGLAADAMRRLESLESVESAVQQAEARAWVGDSDAAFQSLLQARKGVEDAETAMGVALPLLETRVSHFLAPLHDDPRWQDWLANLPLQDIHPPPGLAEKTLARLALVEGASRVE